MTIGEFLHPLAKAKQRDLVLAAMYYLARYEQQAAVTTADIAAAFKRAKNSKGAKIQLAAVLNQAVPYVESPGGKENGRLLWSLTTTGETHVRELLGLPAAEPEVEHDVGTLRALAAAIADDNARGYVDESIRCLQTGALRASVVFLWTGAVATLRDHVWVHGGGAINTSIRLHDPKAREFKKKEDFAYVNDATLIQLAQDLSVIDKTEKTQLIAALDLRNGCGHPTKYSPGVKRVSAFIEDLVGIVWAVSA